MNTPEYEEKEVVYTAIPKFLQYYNLRVGIYVEELGYTVNTPWQYTYAMGFCVDYGELKDSLYNLLTASDEMWVFSERRARFPYHEDAILEGQKAPGTEIGVTDGVVDEVMVSRDENIPVKIHHLDAETGKINDLGYITANSI